MRRRIKRVKKTIVNNLLHIHLLLFLSPSYLSKDIAADKSFDNNRLTSIDVISVDKQSRVTLTKKAKKIIPLEPGDKIAIYQDIYNKNIILKVQKQQQQQQQQQQENNN